MIKSACNWTGKAIATAERKKWIPNGIHYCEMLPLEYKPSDPYLAAYYAALEAYAKATAAVVCRTAEKIKQREGENIVLVSLARAGIPIGILLKHYLEKNMGIQFLTM